MAVQKRKSSTCWRTPRYPRCWDSLVVRIRESVLCSPDGVHAWAVVQDIRFNVHAHPTLSEVLDELFKGAHVAHAKPAKAPAALDTAKQPVAA